MRCDTVLHLGREIDDFTSYTWYEEVDDGDTRSREGFMDYEVFGPTCGPPSHRLSRELT
jgi:nitric oxide dioxygenase